MGKWRGYLVELKKKGVDWTNPLELIAFAKLKLEHITPKAAQQVIDSFKNEIDSNVELELAKQEWEDVNDGTS